MRIKKKKKKDKTRQIEWSKQATLPTKHLDTANSKEVTASESRLCSCLVMSLNKTLGLIISEF